VLVVSKKFELSLLLTAEEVAELLRTSRKVIYEMARLGRLPGVTRIGRRILFRRDRLLQFLRERESSVSSLGGEA
jgi:excisionase family DNA binding protein